jgi:hypothetical protein
MIKKLKFDIDKYKFRELVSEAFGVDDLEKLHEFKQNWIKDEYKKLNVHNENTTIFHEEFYKNFHYQYLPTFRIHLPFDNQAIHTWHYDSDQLHRHPIGEINIWLPLTRCYRTNTMWIESEPFKLDFKPLEGGYGDFWINNGNVCIHGNKPNITNNTRISFDFRVIPISKYNPRYGENSESHSNKFIVGSYYKEIQDV